MQLICAGIIISILNELSGKNKPNTIFKMLSGIFMAIVAITPLFQCNITFPDQNIAQYYEDAIVLSRQGAQSSDQKLNTIISEEAQAYILDKAKAMGVCSEVDLKIDIQNQKPVSAVITAVLTDFEKDCLENLLENELNMEGSTLQWRIPDNLPE